MLALCSFPAVLTAGWAHVGHLDSAFLEQAGQTAAEAAAKHLDGSEQGAQDARAAAEAVLARASTDDSGRIQLRGMGLVHADAAIVTSVPASLKEANAVRLTVGFEEPTMPQLLASWTGAAEEWAAVAVRWSEGAGAVDCYLPIAIPIDLAMTKELTLGSQVSLAARGQPTVAGLTAQTGDCWLGGSLALGEVLRPAMLDDHRVWDALARASKRSRGLQGPAALVDDEGFVVGFAWATIEDVHGRSARIRLLESNIEGFGTEGGGPDHGVRWSEVRSTSSPARPGAA